MFSREDSKNLRLEFWERFKKYSALRRRQKGLPSNWIMNRTGISQLKLKFEFDTTRAIVGIDVESRNMDKRLELFGKLEEFKTILHSQMGEEMIWDLDYLLENQKSISRVYMQIENVNIYEKEDWPVVFPFFYKNMMKLEIFFNEFKDVLKA